MDSPLTYEKILELFAKSDERFERRILAFEESIERSIEKSIENSEKEREKERIEREKNEKKRQKDYDDRMRKLEGNWGHFVESLVRPGLIEIFEAHGIYLRDVYSNIFGYQDNQRYYEIDLFAIDDIYAVAVEVKTTLRVPDVDEHLKRLAKIQENPPRNFALKGKSILGAVAGITIQDNADKYAQKNGLYVLSQKGNLLDMVNPVYPREWKIE